MAKENEKYIVSGQVEAVSDTGMKINGQWYTYGKWLKGDKPSRGDQVVMDCMKNFVNEIQVQGKAEKHEAQEQGMDRDTRIMRQALLNSSVNILGSKGTEVLEWEVTRMAARLEQYVLTGVPLPKPSKEQEKLYEIQQAPREELPLKQTSTNGHAFHGDIIADARVKTLMVNKEMFEAYGEEDLKNNLAVILKVEKPTCLHRFVKDLSNWAKCTKYIRNYGKEDVQ